MSPSTYVLVLASTIVAGGAGFLAAALVALITQAPRLRYSAYTVALCLSLVPLVCGTPIFSVPRATYIGLSGMVPIGYLRWVVRPPSHGGWLWNLAHPAPGLLIVYALGAATCLGRLVLRWTALRRILGAATPLDAGRLDNEISFLPVRVSNDIRSALLIGIHRPVAVLPAKALARMDASQLRSVLAHEEAHALRGDNLRILAEETLRAVLWFNPFVAWSAIRAAESREQLCDQAVLRGADALKRRAYAETLLIAFRLGSQPAMTSSFINPGRRKLVERFNTILDPAKATFTKAAASIGVLAVAALFAGFIGAAAWAETPIQKVVNSPVDIKADRVMRSGCETIFSGNATAREIGLA